jgi:hypothetical protein
MATPRKLWGTNVGLRPATHIMRPLCLAIFLFRIAIVLGTGLLDNPIQVPFRGGHHGQGKDFRDFVAMEF